MLRTLLSKMVKWVAKKTPNLKYYFVVKGMYLYLHMMNQERLII